MQRRQNTPHDSSKTGSDIAESIQTVVTGALSTALTPILQNLQSAAASAGPSRQDATTQELDSEDDFESVPKKR